MSIDTAQWSVLSDVHTFTETGRQARLRRSLPVMVLVDRAAEHGIDDIFGALEKVADGSLKDASLGWKVSQLLVQLMFVEPTISVDDGPGDVPIDALEDSERQEALELAMKGVAQAARFRADADGDDAGADGADLAKPAKRARRPASGKR